MNKLIKKTQIELFTVYYDKINRKKKKMLWFVIISMFFFSFSKVITLINIILIFN